MRKIEYKLAGGSIYGARTKAFKLPQQVHSRTYIASDKTRVLAISEGLWDIRKESTYTNIAAMLTVNAACSMFDDFGFNWFWKQKEDELKLHLIHPVEKAIDEFSRYVNDPRKYNLDASLLMLAVNRDRYIWLSSSTGHIINLFGRDPEDYEMIYAASASLTNPFPVRLEYADHRISVGKGKISTESLGIALLSSKVNTIDPLGETPHDYNDEVIADCLDHIIIFDQESESSAIIRSIMRSRFPKVRSDDDLAMLFFSRLESERLLKGEDGEELTCEVFDPEVDINGNDLGHDCFMNPVHIDE